MIQSFTTKEHTLIRDILQYLLFAVIVLMSVSLLSTLIGQYGVSVGIDFVLIIVVIGVCLITREHWK